jgi:transposase-like protein
MAGQEQLKRDSLTKKEVRKRVTDHLISRNLLNVGNYKQLAADILDELGLKVSHETIRKICLEHRPKLAQASPGLPLGD